MVEAGGYGEGGAGFFEDSGLEEFGFADGWKEAREFDESEGEDLFGGLAEFAERGADDELEVLAVGGWLIGLEAADEGLVEHPLDAGVEQGGVFEVGDGAIEPEVDGGDGGVGEVGERRLDALARRGVFGERGEEACGLLEGEGEEQGGGVVAVAVGRGDLPEAVGEALDAAIESMLVRGWKVVPCSAARLATEA